MRKMALRSAAIAALLLSSYGSCWSPPNDPALALRETRARVEGWATAAFVATSIAFCPVTEKPAHASVETQIASSWTKIELMVETKNFIRLIENSRGDLSTAVSSVAKETPSSLITIQPPENQRAAIEKALSSSTKVENPSDARLTKIEMKIDTKDLKRSIEASGGDLSVAVSSVLKDLPSSPIQLEPPENQKAAIENALKNLMEQRSNVRDSIKSEVGGITASSTGANSKVATVATTAAPKVVQGTTSDIQRPPVGNKVTNDASVPKPDKVLGEQNQPTTGKAASDAVTATLRKQAAGDGRGLQQRSINPFPEPSESAGRADSWLDKTYSIPIPSQNGASKSFQVSNQQLAVATGVGYLLTYPLGYFFFKNDVAEEEKKMREELNSAGPYTAPKKDRYPKIDGSTVLIDNQENPSAYMQANSVTNGYGTDPSGAATRPASGNFVDTFGGDKVLTNPPTQRYSYLSPGHTAASTGTKARNYMDAYADAYAAAVSKPKNYSKGSTMDVMDRNNGWFGVKSTSAQQDSTRGSRPSVNMGGRSRRVDRTDPESAVMTREIPSNVRGNVFVDRAGQPVKDDSVLFSLKTPPTSRVPTSKESGAKSRFSASRENSNRFTQPSKTGGSMQGGFFTFVTKSPNWRRAAWPRSSELAS